jgi:arabinofuranosyltransferase
VAAGLLTAVAALSSKALVDYSTSGLENPCSHLLIVMACFVLLRMDASPRRVFALAFLSALMCLNRQDSLLLTGPLVLVGLVESPTRRSVAAATLGMLPLVAWEVFSVAYYGSLVPNTAHAKLGHGIDTLAVIGQGWNYFTNSLALDPLTLIATGVAVGIALARGDRRQRAIAAGIVGYLVYVLWIGGDFMSGRFFSMAFMAALALIADWQLTWPRTLILAGMALGLALVAPRPSLTSGSDCGTRDRNALTDAHGVCDERAFYYPWTGLLVARPSEAATFHPWAQRGARLAASGQRVAVEGNIGLTGFFAGPAVYIIDPHALSDAFLSRLPALRTPRWRIGHLEHVLPEGYIDTKLERSDLLRDADLRGFYDRLQFVISGPFWDESRLAAACRLALGLDGPGPSAALARFRDPALLRSFASDLPQDDVGRFFSWPGIVLDLGQSRGDRLRISLDADDGYAIYYYSREKALGSSLVLGASFPTTAGLLEQTVRLPPEAIDQNICAIQIVPVYGDGAYAVGGLEVLR